MATRAKCETNGGERAESSDQAETGGDEPKSPQGYVEWDWSTDAENPYNWPSGRKAWQVVMVSLGAFLTYGEIPAPTPILKFN